MSEEPIQLKLITIGQCTFHGHPNVSVTVDQNMTLRLACRQAGIPVTDTCGGKGQCGQCVITIVKGMNNCTPKTHLEEGLFYLGKRDRLSCQCYIDGDVRIASHADMAEENE